MDAIANSSSPVTHRLAQTILRRAAGIKNQRIGDAIGKDESTVSRICSGEYGLKVSELQGFLTALGLKVVDAGMVCVDRAVYESYKTLATKALTNPKALEWDEAV